MGNAETQQTGNYILNIHRKKRRKKQINTNKRNKAFQKPYVDYLLKKPFPGGRDERDIIDRLRGRPHARIVTPDFKPISGVNHVVARALDTAARRRKDADATAIVRRA